MAIKKIYTAVGTAKGGRGGGTARTDDGMLPHPSRGAEKPLDSAHQHEQHYQTDGNSETHCPTPMG